MKKEFVSFLIICIISTSLKGQLPSGQPQGTQAPDILIAAGTNNTDLIYRVNGRDGKLYQAYLGSKLNETSALLKARDAGHQAYPVFGTGNLFEPALRMTHNDGNTSLELKYTSHNSENQSDDSRRR